MEYLETAVFLATTLAVLLVGVRFLLKGSLKGIHQAGTPMEPIETLLDNEAQYQQRRTLQDEVLWEMRLLDLDTSNVYLLDEWAHDKHAPDYAYNQRRWTTGMESLQHHIQQAKMPKEDRHSAELNSIYAAGAINANQLRDMMRQPNSETRRVYVEGNDDEWIDTRVEISQAEAIAFLQEIIELSQLSDNVVATLQILRRSRELLIAGWSNSNEYSENEYMKLKTSAARWVDQTVMEEAMKILRHTQGGTEAF